MNRTGFTLIEIAVVTALLGLMSYLFLPSLAEGIERARIRDEDLILEELREEIVRSFSSVDAMRNVACLPAHDMGDSASLTQFDIHPRGSFVTGFEWYSKLERNRGGSFEVGAGAELAAQGALSRIAFNGLEQPRLLIVGPEEAGQCRYLLLSLVAPASRGLHLPVPDGSAEWFDAIWQHEWENPSGSLPTLWAERLTPDEQLAWQDGRGSTTNLACLRVSRIVQPKHKVVFNNTHATNSAWLDAEGRVTVVSSAPRSGVTSSSEFLAGRRMSIRRGATAPGTEVLRFHLHEETSITIQP
ncbi:MAG: prepilin-type N-terminal cleavage/methylation domain-containing protein [Opitutaceae bacterium]|nr:prepilin-type N-terminal cleavage/methylation domain-containing protein [Opitutaceae bacterium]